jgi:transposase
LNNPNRSTPLPEGPLISRRQATAETKMKELGDYIYRDNMKLADASKKVNVSYPTGLKYYRKYANNFRQGVRAKSIGDQPQLCTQKQINQLISYIVDKKMPVTKASEKINISRRTGAKYYHQYMNDPNRAIPIPKFKSRRGTLCTSEKIKKLIHYVVDDKMSVKAVSKKADISYISARKYYHLYSKDPNHEIPIPRNEGGYETTKHL